MGEDTVCTTVVAHTPSAGPDLAVTGVDAGPLLMVGAVGVVVLLVGALMMIAHRRRSRGTPLALSAVAGVALAGLFVGSVPAGAAVAAEPAAEGCVLIRVDDVTRGGAENLLPGQDPVPVLGYSVTNVTAFAIDVSVSTAVTSDPAGASGLVTTILTGSEAPAPQPLAAVAPTTPVRLAAGETHRYQYKVALDVDAGNTAQDASMIFDSVITATQH